MLFKEKIIGSRNFSNICWASIILIGSLSFLIVGLSSTEILFFPQGIVMCFYGFIGLLLSIYLWFVILWKIGEGYNEFNKENGTMKVFRWGFPGKNRRIQMIYSINDIEGLRIELKEGINPTRALYVKLKGDVIIPITQIKQPLTLEEIEKKAASLASFLQVQIEYIK